MIFQEEEKNLIKRFSSNMGKERYILTMLRRMQYPVLLTLNLVSNFHVPKFYENDSLKVKTE